MGTAASLGAGSAPEIDAFEEVDMDYMKLPLSGLSDFFKELM